MSCGCTRCVQCWAHTQHEAPHARPHKPKPIQFGTRILFCSVEWIINLFWRWLRAEFMAISCVHLPLQLQMNQFGECVQFIMSAAENHENGIWNRCAFRGCIIDVYRIRVEMSGSPVCSRHVCALLFDMEKWNRSAESSQQQSSVR